MNAVSKLWKMFEAGEALTVEEATCLLKLADGALLYIQDRFPGDRSSVVWQIAFIDNIKLLDLVETLKVKKEI
jgi:hypothetical protein